MTETALKSLIEVGKELQATTGVFVAPPEFAASLANKAAVKDFLLSVKKKFGRVVWEPPALWNLDDADARLADHVGAVAARDLLDAGYVRRARSRTTACRAPRGTRAATRTPPSRSSASWRARPRTRTRPTVFTNVDMFADAKRLKKVTKA